MEGTQKKKVVTGKRARNNPIQSTENVDIGKLLFGDDPDLKNCPIDISSINVEDGDVYFQDQETLQDKSDDIYYYKSFMLYILSKHCKKETLCIIK